MSVYLSVTFYPYFLEQSFCLLVCQVLSSLLELSVCRLVCYVFSSLSWVDFLCFSFAICTSDPLSVCLLRFILTFSSRVSVFFSVTFYPHFQVEVWGVFHNLYMIGCVCLSVRWFGQCSKENETILLICPLLGIMLSNPSNACNAIAHFPQSYRKTLSNSTSFLVLRPHIDWKTLKLICKMYWYIYHMY